MNRLKVSLKFGDDSISVGELVRNRTGEIYFRFYDGFLETGLEISPFKLPCIAGIQRASTQIFDGLFGVFADSLPDGWGRLLLDRALLARGVRLNEVDPLTRLAYVGKNGMGALTYEPVAEMDIDHTIKIELDELAAEAAAVLSEQEDVDIDDLLKLGGSSAGARPKILVHSNAENGNLLPSHLPLEDSYEPWLIKFTSSQDGTDAALIEYAYAITAVKAGLNMSEVKLFRGKSGQLYFGTKRFDRIGSKRFHMHSLAGMLHDNFRLSSLDYGHIMDVVLKLEKDVGATSSVLRLAAFNVFAFNRDDHSKNISFLMDQKGHWRLAPAYDLTFSPSAHGHHSMTVGGEGKDPGSKQLLNLADTFGLANGADVIEEVRSAVAELPTVCRGLGVRRESIKRIASHMESMMSDG
ncbi:MAG: type II toxin-antitoxin system HipA family toxin [Bacteroidota bacterium]